MMFDSPPPVADQFRELFRRHQRLLRDLTSLLTEWREAQIPEGQAMGLLEEALARVTIPVEQPRPLHVVAEPPQRPLNAPTCRDDGTPLVQAGTCHYCPSCGSTDGCA